NSNSPFLFIGSSSEKIIAYRRDAQGEFVIVSKAIDPPSGFDGKTVDLKIFPKDKQFVPWYSFDASTWLPINECVISTNIQRLVGFAISSGSASEHVS